MSNKDKFIFPKEDIVKLYRDLESLWISILIDGGWWIDILIWEQTREHEDLDIVLEERHLARFIEWTFCAKFIIWPILIAGIVFLDTSLLHIFSAEVHKVLILMSIVPLAANTVAIATELRTHPEKASVAVLLSTVFALFFIPLVVSFL